MSQSQASSVINKSLKRSLVRKSGPSRSKPGLLPPVVPGSAKNGNEIDVSHGLSKTLTYEQHNRSLSATRGYRVEDTSGRLPLLRLDSEDRKSPEKTIAKISTSIANIEQGKMKEIEHENVTLGAQLNNLNYVIYRKDKELK